MPLLFLLAAPVVAQREASLADLLSSRASVASAVPSEFAQEGAVDADRYIVGPGDVFTLSIGGAPPVQFPLPVGADGMVAIPEVGALDVAGQTLAQVRARLSGAVQPLYRNVPVAVTLTQPRRFVVHIGGAVPNPGRRVVGPTPRLSDAVRVAFQSEPERADEALTAQELAGLTAAPDLERRSRATLTPDEREALPPEDLSDAFAPHLRAVVVERAGEAPVRYDLLRYRRTGDAAHNPYLRDGDRIFVPAYHRARDVAFVSGGVPFPGPYPVRADDTAADLVAVAGGSSSAEIAFVSGAAAGAAAPVAAGTTVYVDEQRLAGFVRVEGEVAYPGLFRITSGETTAREVIEQAGGVLSDALTRGAFIQRGDRAADAAVQRAVTTPGDLPFVTRASLASQVAGAGVGGPSVMWLSGTDSVVLYDGDRLVVPRDEGTVLVLGGVGRPGYVPVQAGADAGTYLQAAGGLRSGVRGVFVQRAGAPALVPASEAGPIASGDVLLAITDDPATQGELYNFSLQERNLRLQSERDVRQARVQTIQAVATAVSVIATAITTYFLIDERL